ncbi:MAG: hypothetical protein JWP56_853 [Aeromicrobium sp.]|nr:hypothetical protein [Aeromicrobium sp.]
MFLLPLAVAIVLLALLLRTLVHDLRYDGHGLDPLQARFGWDHQRAAVTATALRATRR